jgi:hypothetical protein
MGTGFIKAPAALFPQGLSSNVTSFHVGSQQWPHRYHVYNQYGRGKISDVQK